jgi:hypothetical protein
MLYIEEEGLSPRNLSPVFLDIGKGHKSDGDVEAPPTPSQVSFLSYLTFSLPKIIKVVLL